MDNASILVRPGQEAGPGSVHWLPIKTGHTGPCKVDEFFQPTESSEQSTSGSGVLEVNLRGRLLKGCQRQLPEGYVGVVIAPAAPTAASSADERAYCSSATFSGLTYWNHDSTPAAADWQARTLDWLALADKVHAPVSQQAVEEEFARLQQQAGASS